MKIFHGKQTKVKNPVSITVHSISGQLGNEHFLTQEYLISLLRDIVRSQLRSASEQMRTTRKEAMLLECCKLKMGPSLPWSLLQMTEWEKNAFGFTKD